MKLTGINTRAYELILEGLRDNSEAAREELRQVLEREDIAGIFEIDAVLDGGPFLLKRSYDKESLQVAYRDLQSVGAQVLLVQAKAEKKPAKPRRKASLSLVPPVVDPIQAEITERSFASLLAARLSEITQLVRAIPQAEIDALIREIMVAQTEERQIYIFGHGASSLCASRFADSLLKSKSKDRRDLFRAICLNDQASVFRGTGDDGEDLFVNQLRIQIRPGDLVIGFSACGKNQSLLRGISYANQRGAMTFGVLGSAEGKLRQCARRCISIPDSAAKDGLFEDAVMLLNKVLAEYLTS